MVKVSEGEEETNADVTIVIEKRRNEVQVILGPSQQNQGVQSV